MGMGMSQARVRRKEVFATGALRDGRSACGEIIVLSRGGMGIEREENLGGVERGFTDCCSFPLCGPCGLDGDLALLRKSRS
jgi:hypothetical protein